MGAELVVSEEQVHALRVYVEALEKGATHALAILKEGRDADTLRRRAKLLLDLHRPHEAIDLLRDEQLDPPLREQLLRAYIRAGELQQSVDLAKSVLESDIELYGPRACVIAYYEIQESVRDQLGALDEYVLTDLPADVQEALRGICSLCARAATQIRNTGGIQTTLDRLIGICLLQLQTLVDSRPSAETVELLAHCRPFPLELATVAVARLLTPEEYWIEAIQQDHPDSIDAFAIANVLDAIYFDNASQAFSRLLLRSRTTNEPSHRRQLFTALHEVSNLLGTAERESTKSIANDLLRDQPDLKGLFDAEMALIEGSPLTAENLLEVWQDNQNPMWVQLAGHLARSTGEYARAIAILGAYSEKKTHVAILTLLANVSFEASDYAKARDALLRLVKLQPSNVSIHRNLALTYIRLNEKANAIPYLLTAAGLRPDDAHVTQLAAQCLADTGETQQACQILRAFVEKNAKEIRPRLLLASFLSADAKTCEAFELLHDVFDDLINEPSFLFAYMESAHRAGRDRDAHTALTNLLRLKEAGHLPEGALWTATIDDVMRAGKEHRDRVERANTDLLSGQIPWITVAELSNNVAYFEWFVRTQPIKWHGERRSNVAAYSLYATNSFTVVRQNDLPPVLEEIAAISQGESATFDISALITVFDLGLFEDLGRYFSRVFIPAVYVETSIQDKPRLLPHQLSQRTSLESLRSAVADKRLHVRTDSDGGPDRLAEYDESDTSFRLQNLLAALNERGILSRSDEERLRTVAHKQAIPTVLPLQIPLLVELLTLRTLVSESVFDIAAENWNLQISSSDWEELQATLNQFEIQEKLYETHERLWESVRQASFVTLVPLPSSTEPDEQNASRRHAFGAGLVVSHTTMTPLCVDDRFVQQLALNAKGTSQSSAFGVDAWLCALLSVNGERAEELAQKYLLLLERRYKFLLPTIEMLAAILRVYPQVVPNKGLHSIARYVHLCFRDPGLYAAAEPVTPPVSVALRLYMSWIGRLANLVAYVWGSEQFSETFAGAVTLWAIRDCMPPAPQSLGLPSGARITQTTRNLLLTHFSIAAVEYQNIDEGRMINAWASIKQGLNIADDEYVLCISDVLDRLLEFADPEIATEAQAAQARLGFGRQLLRRAFAHQGSWPIHIENLLYRLDIAPPERAFAQERLTSALMTAKSRLGPYPSPIVAYFDATDDGSRTLAIETLWVLLYAPHQQIREAAGHEVAEVLRAVDPLNSVATTVWSDLELIRSDDPSIWRPASARLHGFLRGDFRIAGLALLDSMVIRNGEANDDDVAAVLTLSDALLAGIDLLLKTPDESKAQTRSASSTHLSVSIIGWIAPLEGLTREPMISEVLSRATREPMGWHTVAELASGITHSPRGLGLRYAVMSALAEHYAQTIESGLPGIGPSLIAECALALGSYVEWIAHMRTGDRLYPWVQWLEPMLGKASSSWWYARAKLYSSTTYARTVRRESPLMNHIVHAIKRELHNPQKSEPSTEQVEIISTFLRIVLVTLAIDPSTEATEDTSEAVEVSKLWIGNHKDSQLEVLVNQVDDFRLSELKTEVLLSRYETLPSIPDSDRAIILRQVDSAVRSGVLPSERILERWSDSAWRERTLSALDDQSLDQLIYDCASWLDPFPTDDSVRWVHDLTETALSFIEDSERFRRCATYVLVAALRTNVISAVDRLYVQSTGSHSMAQVREAASTIRSKLTGAPPWLLGRMRSVFISLNL